MSSTAVSFAGHADVPDAHTQLVPVPGLSVDSDAGPVDLIAPVEPVSGDPVEPVSGDGVEPVSGEGETGLSVTDHDALTRRLDSLSLRQALIDFELANARVLDLTARLIEVTNASVRRQAELDGLRQRVAMIESECAAADRRATESAVRVAALTTEIAAIRSSSTYRALRFIGRMRRLVGLGG